jgi:hypothetical protein
MEFMEDSPIGEYLMEFGQELYKEEENKVEKSLTENNEIKDEFMKIIGKEIVKETGRIHGFYTMNCTVSYSLGNGISYYFTKFLYFFCFLSNSILVIEMKRSLCLNDKFQNQIQKTIKLFAEFEIVSRGFRLSNLIGPIERIERETRSKTLQKMRISLKRELQLMTREYLKFTRNESEFHSSKDETKRFDENNFHSDTLLVNIGNTRKELHSARIDWLFKIKDYYYDKKYHIILLELARLNRIINYSLENIVNELKFQLEIEHNSINIPLKSVETFENKDLNKIHLLIKELYIVYREFNQDSNFIEKINQVVSELKIAVDLLSKQDETPAKEIVQTLHVELADSKFESISTVELCNILESKLQCEKDEYYEDVAVENTDQVIPTKLNTSSIQTHFDIMNELKSVIKLKERF